MKPSRRAKQSAGPRAMMGSLVAVFYTHLLAHETVLDPVCRLLLEKNNTVLYFVCHLLLDKKQNLLANYTKPT